MAIAMPVGIAAIPIGAIFGALAVQKGLSPLEATLMSLLVFAGASQFVAIDIWQQPVPWLLLGVTALTVNLRHVMMSASIGRHFQHFGPVERWIYLFFLTDEVWAFCEKRAMRAPLYPAYFAGIAFVLVVSWSGWTAAGALLGAAMGSAERYGLDFVFTALFVGLLVGFWKGPRTGIVMGTSGVAAAIAHEAIAGPWYILIGGLAGTAAGALMLAPTRQQEQPS
ncbi:AzlC family ABC transporter permease [Rhodoligotrophos defluvii]|uniref:AzlC family ABC transporter permease n=1 Tax=Rhodoligotrophos defluvii TaxID=2561934 RepID=UPI001EEFE900|nr:AzlC family ABC transporter permease [Rhodoligotrophos defluvii]